MPSLFYFDVESVGSLEPDAIIQQGIKVLQQKLAAVIQELTGAGDGGARGLNGDAMAMDMNGYGAGPRSPDMNGVGLGGRDYDMDHGYTTPFVNGGGGGGGASAWGGGGGTTPYGATPYGQNGY